MEISEFAFRLIILFFPGLIAAYIINCLTVHKPREPFFFVAQSLALGAASYCFLEIVCKKVSPFLNAKYGWSWPTNMEFFNALSNSKVIPSFGEIGYACICAVIIGLVVTIFSTYKIFYLLCKNLWITSKSGELDVWGMTFSNRKIQFVTIRDHAKDLVYDGWIEGFSNDGKKAELLLRDVAVYRNSNTELLYQIGAMYFELKRGEIVLEFRDVPLLPQFKAVESAPAEKVDAPSAPVAVDESQNVG